jgi:aquaporin Z
VRPFKPERLFNNSSSSSASRSAARLSSNRTSVNPARSIGVGVFAGVDAVAQLWLFILAPLLGGAIAGFSYALLLGRGAEDVPGSGLRFVRIQIAPDAMGPGVAAPGVGAVPGYGAPDQLQEQWNPETDEGQPPP